MLERQAENVLRPRYRKRSQAARHLVLEAPVCPSGKSRAIRQDCPAFCAAAHANPPGRANSQCMPQRPGAAARAARAMQPFHAWCQKHKIPGTGFPVPGIFALFTAHILLRRKPGHYGLHKQSSARFLQARKRPGALAAICTRRRRPFKTPGAQKGACAHIIGRSD